MKLWIMHPKGFVIAVVFLVCIVLEKSFSSLDYQRLPYLVAQAVEDLPQQTTQEKCTPHTGDYPDNFLLEHH